MRRASGGLGADRFRVRDVFVMVAGAWYWPWTVVSANPADLTRVDRVLVVVIGLGLLSLAVGWCLTRFGATPAAAALATCGVMLILTTGGGLVRAFGTLIGYVMSFVIIGLLAWLSRRLQPSVTIIALGVALAVTLLSGPAMQTFRVVSQWSEPALTKTVMDLPPMAHTPDILLVILDGYPGLRTWTTDLGHLENDVASELAHRGFEVPASAWSAYPRSIFAIPSLLDMGHPATQDVSRSGLRQLYQTIGGDNAFTRALVASGYDVVYVGSNWSGFSCGPLVTECRDAGFLDEMTSYIASGSLIVELVMGPAGHPFSAGVDAAMDWSDEHLVGILGGDTPTLAVMHMMIPHRPIVFDRYCTIRSDRVRRGLVTGGPAVGTPEWDAWFADQTACANRWLMSTLDDVPPSTAVVIVSDHGTERRFHQTRTWSNWALAERLNVLAALRTDIPGCRLGDPVMLPNVLRRLLGCMSGVALAQADHRMFTSELAELHPASVERLIGLKSASQDTR